MKTKVTLTLDEDLVPRAKSLAQQKGTSLSQLVEETLYAQLKDSAGPAFSEKWKGKFILNEGADPRMESLKKEVSEMTLFVDCDVILDVLLSREDFVDASAGVLDAVEQRDAIGFVSGHSLANIYYLCRSGSGKASTLKALDELTDFLIVVPGANLDFKRALSLGMPDFEDAMQTACALACNAERIITRNLKDFKKSPVKACTPAQWIAENK